MEPFCKIRDFYRAITDFETRFEKRYGLCLNEGMLLCCLRQEPRLSSGDIAKLLGLTHSNTSKVIRSVEKKVSSNGYWAMTTNARCIFL